MECRFNAGSSRPMKLPGKVKLLGNVKLFIYRGAMPVATAWVRGVSRTGIFVETHITNFSLLHPVDVCLPLSLAEGSCTFRFSPLVFGRSRRGLGLNIVRGDIQGRQALAALLGSHQPMASVSSHESPPPVSEYIASPGGVLPSSCLSLASSLSAGVRSNPQLATAGQGPS